MTHSEIIVEITAHLEQLLRVTKLLKEPATIGEYQDIQDLFSQIEMDLENGNKWRRTK